jgi:hypothetical protein
MDILQIIRILIALATIATGLLALLRPHSIRGFTGLIADGPRGVSEIRAVLGGAFIGLGLAALLLGGLDAYRTLGITYSAIAAVRAISIVVDRSPARSNLISLVVEVVFGVLLLV